MSKNKIKYWVVPAVLAVALLLIVRSGILPFAKKTEAVSGAHAISIAASTAQPLQAEPKLTLTGTVEGETSGIISAKIGGRIAAVLVEDGQFVQAGQPLLRLDQLEMGNAVRIAQDVLRRAQANYDNAASDYNRYRILYEQRAISEQQLEGFSTKLQIAAADLSSAQASLSNANEQYSYSVVVAPVSGVVANKTAVIGQVVAAGQQLMNVMDIGKVYAVVNVEQKDMGVLQAGMPAEVTVDAYPGKSFAGTVDIINPTAMTSNRVFRTKVKLDNGENALKPGMFVKVNIAVGAPVTVMAVPQNAVFQKQGVYYVFAVKDDKVLRQKVEVGRVLGDAIEIKGGLDAQTLVATTNVNILKDGDTVTVNQ